MKKFSWEIIVGLAVAGILGILLGRLLPTRTSFRNNVSATVQKKSKDSSAVQAKQQATIWTCSMHPQIRMKKPGKCPICGMKLIPLKGNNSSDSVAIDLHLTPEAETLAEIQTFPVVRKYIYSSIRMTGKIAMDEELMAYITARMPGRIDKLFVNYTGIPVAKGDHMAEYYSPDLLVAQRELLLAVNNMKKKAATKAYLDYGMSPAKLLATVKKKLIYWGLTEKNISKIIASGKISQHITLYSPISGIVIQKNALEGKYFKTGDRLFSVADLSTVWVMLEAYESDIAKLRYGQKVVFHTDAFPGKTFTGRISFIDPVMDKKRRIINVRVDASNKNGSLKPGMFVTAMAEVELSDSGRIVMDKSLAGKWIGPMHPDIIRDHPGECPICGMKLVKAETLGYAVTNSANSEPPLVIPVTAPLITGKRAVVYVQTAPGIFQGREVVLGPRGNGAYIVKRGLKEGELVVTNGNFKIDSSLQILAKPSMMSGNNEKISTKKDKLAGTLGVPKSFTNQLGMIYSAYFKIQKALSQDDLKGALAGVKNLKMMLGHISDKELEKNAGENWRKLKDEIAEIANNSLKSKKINDLRAGFANLSASVDELKNRFGTSKKFKIRKFFCPMAFNNKGANWLQNKESEVNNPYLGKTMLRCGELVK